MIVYTVQHEAAWKAWKEQGYITGDDRWVEPGFKIAYQWMKNRMKKEITSYQREQPIWVWTSDNYPNRNAGAWGKKGERFVILTLEVPDCEILWSDFQVWNGLLNESIQYQESINRQISEPFEVWEKEMEKEYAIMFDFSGLRDHPDWYSDMSEEIEKQGVIGRMSLSVIKKVQRFREPSKSENYSKRTESRTKRISRKARKEREKRQRLNQKRHNALLTQYQNTINKECVLETQQNNF